MSVVRSLKLKVQPYSEVALPNGAAPISARDVSSYTDGWADIELFYIDPESVSDVTVFGLYIIKTGNQFPQGLRVFPENHPLINQVLQPNCRYVWTVGDWHLFLGNPKEDEA